jgi:hypothetical protein
MTTEERPAMEDFYETHITHYTRGRKYPQPRGPLLQGLTSEPA